MPLVELILTQIPLTHLYFIDPLEWSMSNEFYSNFGAIAIGDALIDETLKFGTIAI